MTTIVSLGEQVTLPETILSPADSWAQITNLDNHINALKADIALDQMTLKRTAEGTLFYNQWLAFGREWATWYSQVPHGGRGTVGGIVRALTGSEVAQLRIFAGRYNTFEQRFRDLGGTPTEVGNPQGGTPFEVPTIVWAGLGVVALGIVAFATYSASKFAPVLQPVAERFSYSSPALHGRRIRR